MTGMTPERLASIRERLDLWGGLDPLDTADLLDEVDRLRAGIESQIETARREWLDEGGTGAMHRAEHWRDLLNPTGGETDDR